MIFRRNLQTAVLSSAFLAVAAMVAAQNRAQLKVAVAADQKAADLIARQIESLGHGPARIEKQDERFAVYTKSFNTMAEATLIKPYLLGAGFMETEAVAVDGSAPAGAPELFGSSVSVIKTLTPGRVKIDFDRTTQTATAVVRKKITPELRALDNATVSEKDLRLKAFAFSEPADADTALESLETFLKRFPQSETVPSVKLSRAHWILKKGNEEGALEAFDKVIREHPGQPEAGDAEMRSAYLSIRRKRPDAEVLKRFEKVARGEVASRPEARLEAMMRCAALYHKGKDHASAETAYRSIAAVAQDPQVQAYAQMQLGAITLERAWNGEATFEQARGACDEVVSKYPEANVRTRATAALMALETFAYEKKPDQVLARMDSYLRDYGQTEEAQLAYYWFARAAFDTGDLPLARRLAETLVSAKFPTEDRFRLVDVTASANRLLDTIKSRENGM